ncbi:MAG TPA: hypothetical protein VNK48_06085 [Xanthobacteraceae bacterium]|nr:hypothetical protein [Xanthobacteraceae bacterium]
MAKPTIHDRLVAALLAQGERVVTEARTSRYTVLTRKGGEAGFYYIGKAGGLRIGRTVSTSHSVASSYRDRLLSE